MQPCLNTYLHMLGVNADEESCIRGYHASLSVYWRFDRLAFAEPLGLPVKLLAEVQLLTNSLSD